MSGYILGVEEFEAALRKTDFMATGEIFVKCIAIDASIVDKNWATAYLKHQRIRILKGKDLEGVDKNFKTLSGFSEDAFEDLCSLVK